MAFGPSIIGLAKLVRKAEAINKATNEEKNARKNANTIRQTAQSPSAGDPTQADFLQRRASILKGLLRGSRF